MTDMGKPGMIIASRTFYACYLGEMARQEWLDKGANWRRAKREARKATERSLRDRT
jgi:hypothetical protein